MAKYFTIILLLILLSTLLSAKYDNPSTGSGQSIKFERISAKQGLSKSEIKCIYKV